MELGVLGPLQLIVDDAPVEIGPAKQRALLATLAAHANTVVSVDCLVRALWGHMPPRSAVKNLQVYVYQLRRVLGGHRYLERRPPGYLLRLADDELDARLFARLVARARTAVAEGRPAAAAEVLRRACGLWRGAPYADVQDVSLLRGEIDRLEEERLAAVELRLHVELELGGHATVLGELAALTARHPLRERLRAQLMLGLYRAGRRAEALAVYRDVRRMMVEELGIEPGHELRDLQRRILAGDTALLRPAARSGGLAAAGARGGPSGGAGATARPVPLPPGVPVRPAQLPADVVGFTGRSAALRELDALLDTGGVRTGTAVAAVTGGAGVGKTALAVHWAHRVAARYDDGQLYVDLRGSAGPALCDGTALARLLHGLGVHPARVPADPDLAAGLYRSLLAGKRVLVVLDDARDAEQVRPLVPGGAGCAVLVTSRDPLTGLVASHGAGRVPLGPLAPGEAVRVLAGILGPDWIRAEPNAVGRLVAACDGRPRALRTAAADLAAEPHERVGAYLARQWRHL